MVANNLKELRDAKIVISPAKYDLTSDERSLIPFCARKSSFRRYESIKYGFVNRNGEIVVPAQYDYIYDDFYDTQDTVRIGKIYTINRGTIERPNLYDDVHIGVLNSDGIELIPCDRYIEIFYTSCKNKLVVRKDNYTRGLIDLSEKEIIPFGIYSHIGTFAYDFARTINKEGRGIVDINGNIIVPNGLFEEIWDFNERYSTIVVKYNGIRYAIPFAALQEIQKGSIKNIINFLEYKGYLQHDYTSQNIIATF